MRTTIKDLHTLQKGHVYYKFQDERKYMQHLISFIQTGLEHNNRILIIDNMRNIPKIENSIENLFTQEQKSNIRLVNNFQYYLTNGGFNSQYIVSNFKDNLASLNHPTSSIRSWANVEWASTRPSLELMEEFEAAADECICHEYLLSVCAYSSIRLNEDLHQVLQKVHPYVMTDESFTLSQLYNHSREDI